MKRFTSELKTKYYGEDRGNINDNKIIIISITSFNKLFLFFFLKDYFKSLKKGNLEENNFYCRNYRFSGKFLIH